MKVQQVLFLTFPEGITTLANAKATRIRNLCYCWCVSLITLLCTNSLYKVWNSMASYNYDVLILVIVFIMVYILGLVLFRKKDDKDHRDWRPVVVSDSLPEEALKFKYEVHVHTGNVQDTDQRCKIDMRLQGDLASCKEVKLEEQNHHEHLYKRGTVSSFLIVTDKKLGQLESIDLLVYTTEMKVHWFLNMVVVVDMMDYHWFPFIHRHWVNNDDENVPASQIHLTLFSNSKSKIDLMKRNFLNYFVRRHNFVSAFYRTTKTAFTRVQSWACCVCFIALLMLSGALWFELGQNCPSVTLTSLVFQLCATVIGTLLTALVALVFTKAKISSKEELHYITYAPVSQLQTNPLPHFVINITHKVVMLTVLATSFYLVLSSLEWDKATSRGYMLHLFLGLLLNIVVLQPLHALVLALLSTYYFKTDSDLDMYNDIFPRHQSIAEENDVPLTSQYRITDQDGENSSPQQANYMWERKKSKKSVAIIGIVEVKEFLKDSPHDSDTDDAVEGKSDEENDDTDKEEEDKDIGKEGEEQLEQQGEWEEQAEDDEQVEEGPIEEGANRGEAR